MSTNAFAISRRLAEKGFSKDNADAVAEEIVSHADETHATKADVAAVQAEVARLDAKIDGVKDAITAQFRTLNFIVGGIYIGIAALVIERIIE